MQITEVLDRPRTVQFGLRVPLSRATRQVYRNLLASLGQAFLGQRW
jgi:hypothetical protein